MKKFFLRLALVAVIFPLLYLLLFVVNQGHLLGLHILISAFVVIGALEVTNFFVRAGLPVQKYLAPILAGTLVPFAYAAGFILGSADSLYIWFVLLVCIVLVRACFPLDRKDLSGMLIGAASSVFVIVYPGLLATFMVRITTFARPELVFLLFLVLVFSNEMGAYVFGKLLGKGTRLDLPISPNKTLVGFIAGFLCSVVSAIVFYLCAPDLFRGQFAFAPVLGAVIGASGIIGDLIESGFKRSAALKDSGTIMGGRGGIMDTIDSLLLSGPLFFVLYGLIA